MIIGCNSDSRPEGSRLHCLGRSRDIVHVNSGPFHCLIHSIVLFGSWNAGRQTLEVSLKVSMLKVYNRRQKDIW